MKIFQILATASLLAIAAVPAAAQTTTGQASGQTSTRDRIGAILGTLLGERTGATSSVDAQWAAGQTPLINQRTQFEAQVDTAVRGNTITTATGARMKADYYALVQLETTYFSDRRFTTQERTDLNQRYNALAAVMSAGGYADGATRALTSVADGRAAFDRRVDTSVSARRLSRTQGTRLKADYASLIQVEAGYLNDSRLSAAEQADLDARLDALDVRVGDVSYSAAPLTPQARLAAITQALPSSGLTSAVQAQLRVEHGDVERLAAAYARLSVTAEEQAYLERRLVDLETRSRIRR